MMKNLDGLEGGFGLFNMVMVWGIIKVIKRGGGGNGI